MCNIFNSSQIEKEHIKLRQNNMYADMWTRQWDKTDINDAPYDMNWVNYDKFWENGYIRTPLGAFVNHSDLPNCEFYNNGDYIMLRTIININAGNELTAEYWLYDMGEEYVE